MTSHRGPFVMLAVLVEVNDSAVQGPDEGDVQRRVMRCGTLHPGVFSYFNVSVGWCQGDLCGLWGKSDTDEGHHTGD